MYKGLNDELSSQEYYNVFIIMKNEFFRKYFFALTFYSIEVHLKICSQKIKSILKKLEIYCLLLLLEW